MLYRQAVERRRPGVLFLVYGDVSMVICKEMKRLRCVKLWYTSGFK